MSNVAWFRNMCRSLGVKPILPVLGLSTIDEMTEMFDVGFKFIITRFYTPNGFTDPIIEQYAGKDYTRELFNTVLQTHATVADNPLGPASLLQTFVYDGPIFTNPINVKMNIEPFSRVLLR